MKKYGWLALCAAVACLVLGSEKSTAQEQTFTSWLYSFQQEALEKGISRATVDAAMPITMTPIQKAIELDRKQPEKTIKFTQYRTNVISHVRVQTGREMMRTHAALLSEIENKYNVQPQYIIALWGIETSYGKVTGGFNVVNALATLAWEGRRAEFFKNELVNALQIIDQGHVTATTMKGSWAGAMGQNQFMPSSFLRFAVDEDGDGRKDIWTNKKDVFASTANYLARSGWKGDEKWGRAVKLPAEFSASLVGLETKKSLSTWKSMGVTLPDGAPLPAAEGMEGSIVAPDGVGGPAYLVYDNYRTIMKWNRSTYFATSVGLLADAITQ